MNQVILYTIGIFFLIGGIDYILGSPLKLGGRFEEGIKAMGALGLGMIGIYSLAPVLSKILANVFVPFAKVLHFDPSIFTSLIFAVDMGGYQMAMDLAQTKEMALFSGIILAAGFGAVISFTIPLAVSMIAEEDQKYFSKGVMAGISALPIGGLIAGLFQKIPVGLLLWNLLPIFLCAVLLIIGLLRIPQGLMKGFNIIGKVIVALSTIGLLLQGADIILGIKLVEGMISFTESMMVVGKIAFILGGAYAMLACLNRLFKNSFEKFGRLLGINSESVAGLLGNLASNLVIFGTYDKMNPKGKVICAAFGVGCAFVFGGQLGFVSSVAPEMINTFILSKFAAGIVSILLAAWLYEREEGHNMKSKKESYSVKKSA